ncbi:MAG: threonine synthase, partial [Chitinophagaceae bacterium]
MKYYSTNKQSPLVDFKEAAIRGQAPDKGLYFPETIPRVKKEMIDEIENLTPAEIAFNVIKPYVDQAIPDEILFGIVTETVNFPIPLVKVSEAVYSLE